MTNHPIDEPARGRAHDWRAGVVAFAVLLVAALAAYRNSFDGALVFDDLPVVRDNPTLRSLWPLGGALSPPANSGVGGRPLSNLSLAVNYALGEAGVRGYHVTNLVLHVASAWLLWGIVRRLAPARAGGWPLAAALLWVVHPLATASVSYIAQRTELLMGFFYLLTLHAFVHGRLALSALACACGMLSKEVMATAPAMVLLCDRAFVAGSLQAAWRARRGYYLALGATWLVLAWVLTTGLAQRSVGFGLGVSAWVYAVNSAGAALLYLKLALWPAPLVFDYGRGITTSAAAVVAMGVALSGATWLLRTRPRAGFFAAGFFILLAPTTSFVPVAEQPIAENRMYLPLALVAVGAALALENLVGRRGRVLTVVAVAALALLTFLRNRTYTDAETLWRDTIAKRPQNARAHYNLGVGLAATERLEEARTMFTRAVALEPRYAEAHVALGNAHARRGGAVQVTAAFEEAQRLRPTWAKAWYDHGCALLAAGDAAAARGRFERALALEPQSADAENNLGNAWFALGDAAVALRHYTRALEIEPTLVDARYNAGSACLELGRVEEAVRHFSATAAARDTDAEVRNNLGVALLRAGRAVEAVAAFEAAVRLRPDYADARSNLAVAREAARAAK